MPKQQQTTFHYYDPLATSSEKKVNSKVVLTTDQIKTVLHLNQHQAASQLGISISKLRTVFRGMKSTLSLTRWPKQSSKSNQPCIDCDSDDGAQSCVQDCNDQHIDTTQLKSIKQEDGTIIYHSEPTTFPKYDRSKLYSSIVKRKEHPFTSLVPQIQFLPSLNNDRFDSLLYFVDNNIQVSENVIAPLALDEMKDYHNYLRMKTLEKDLSERLLGRVANGFKKSVRSMPITRCSKTTFQSFFEHHNGYHRSSERKLLGYNRIGDCTVVRGLAYSYEYPYLPSFFSRHWTINEYSILESEESDTIASSGISEEDLALCPGYSDIFKWIEQQEDFTQGWEHIRNMVYRLTVTHNPITEMVTVSFGMVSLCLHNDMTFLETM